jgi:DNA-binding GntR family transcriptional regulator
VSVIDTDGPRIERKSAPEIVADAMREQITAGKLEPGAKIPVDKMAKSIGVSANTLREALQLLEHERLVTQRLNKGIFVRQITEADISDLYAMRRLLEIGTLRHVGRPDPQALLAMRAAVDLGVRSITDKDWSSSSLATVNFHAALVAMLGSERASVTMQRLMAELRLTLSMVHEHLDLRSPFLKTRQELFDLFDAGRFQDAIPILERYLAEGERSMIELYRSTVEG